MRLAVALFLAGTALFARTVAAQEKITIVPGDQCSICKWMMPFHEASTKRGITDQQVMLNNGMAWFFFGGSPDDAKWLQAQFTELGKAMMKPDAKFCDVCASIVKYTLNPKTKSETVPTKTGLVVLMTSTDKAANAAIHVHMKKLMEMGSKAKPGGSECQGPPPEAPGATFLGKGDGVTTCPVTGEPVDKNVSAEINGRTVYFCCQGCVARVKAHPERYLK